MRTKICLLWIAFLVVTISCGTESKVSENGNKNQDRDWPADTATAIVDVTNPATGRTWMDRNLGAGRVATSDTDEQAYGDLYQWGRAADGHQIRTSPTTITLSSLELPGHEDFILSPDEPYDWRSPGNNNLWQGVGGTNNPCPNGYRLPTEAEWDEEIQSWSSSNIAGAFASPLKLPAAGFRGSSNGSVGLEGSRGSYWSSTVVSTYSKDLSIRNNEAVILIGRRAMGRSVRCIKD